MPVISPALEITDATLEFGDGDSKIKVLDDVSLSVSPGEFVGIVGPSGSGKSSLLAVAGALIKPDSGNVRVHGTDLAGLSKGSGARFRLANIGFVFQSDNLLPALTAADQLRLVGRLAGRRDVDVDRLLASVGMSDRADEPTAALDRRRGHEVVGLLAEQARSASVAIVMVTHDHDVLRHCDRVHEMIDGRIGQVEVEPRTSGS